jgi:catechol 2,3-dioxygenase-like lactoylglutathione lyase family enzyme
MMAEPPLKGIDHTLVGVRDLEAARALWTRMGFTVTPRGRHIGWGTANYCIMFHNAYIELLGIVDPTLFTNNLDKFLETREGLMGLAFASDDVEATKARLIAAGLHPDGPKDLKRLLELPEGTVVPEFRLLYLPKEETPDLSAFVCCHLTPELVRRPEWTGHRNGALGLRCVTIVAADPRRSAEGYAPYFGADAIRADDGKAVVASTQGSIRFMTADAYRHRFGQADGIPSLPFPAAMTLDCRSVEATESFLRHQGLRASRSADGALHLEPGDANSALLEFVAA